MPKANRGGEKRKRSEKSARSSGSGSRDSSPAKNKKMRPSDDKEEVERPKNADGTEMIPLGQNKFVTIGQFKGRSLIDIREYYEPKDGGGLKPSKKGIALNPEQFAALEKLMPELRTKLDEMTGDE